MCGFYKSRKEPFMCRKCGQAITWIKIPGTLASVAVNPTVITVVTKNGKLCQGYTMHGATCIKEQQCAGS